MSKNTRLDEIESWSKLLRQFRHGYPVVEEGVLKGFGCASSDATDETIASFPDSDSIEWIDLSHNVVTDNGLVQLLKFPRLSQLYLSGNSLSGGGLPQSTRKDLARLYLNQCNEVSDASIRFVRQCTSLERLDLSKTEITDVALEDLSSLESLEWLNLDDTSVSDRGIMALRRLPRLKHLLVNNTRVTDDGLLALHEYLPALVRPIFL